MLIKSTKDYNRFKFHPLNRVPSMSHVSDLMKSIKKNNQLDINPIIVDFEGRIISGQHRFLAAKNLGVAIHYIEKDVDDEWIISANHNQRRTTQDDAINFYIKYRQDENYVILKKAQDRFKIPVGSIVALIGESCGRNSEVIQGNFKLGGELHEVNEILDNYGMLKDFCDTMPFEYIGVYKTTHFCQGLRKFMDTDKLHWDIFMQKIRKYWTLLDAGLPNASKWALQMAKVYNKRNFNKVEVEE